jgi:glutamate synthase (ferredoxin)
LRGAAQVHSVGRVLDDELLEMAAVKQAVETGGDANVELEITNVDRSSLGRLGGAIAKRFGDKRFPGTIKINLKVRLRPLLALRDRLV